MNDDEVSQPQLVNEHGHPVPFPPIKEIRYWAGYVDYPGDYPPGVPLPHKNFRVEHSMKNNKPFVTIWVQS